jgi:hypothetical protein
MLSIGDLSKIEIAMSGVPVARKSQNLTCVQIHGLNKPTFGRLKSMEEVAIVFTASLDSIQGRMVRKLVPVPR